MAVVTRRLLRLRTTLVVATSKRSRDLLAIAGVGCIAAGLATVAPALAWIAVGAFCLFAAGAGRRSAA